MNTENNPRESREYEAPAPVPFAVHESALSFARETVNRLWIAVILLAVLLFASNVGWLIYEAQFETISYQQDGEGLNNICTGTQGAIVYGAEGEIQEEALRQSQGAKSP